MGEMKGILGQQRAHQIEAQIAAWLRLMLIFRWSSKAKWVVCSPIHVLLTNPFFNTPRQPEHPPKNRTAAPPPRLVRERGRGLVRVG